MLTRNFLITVHFMYLVKSNDIFEKGLSEIAKLFHSQLLKTKDLVNTLLSIWILQLSKLF